MPFTILIQIVTRAFIWIILLSSEIVGPIAVTSFPNNHWFYIAAMLLTAAIFFAISYVANVRLVEDMRDLCLYEFIMYSLGLIFFLLGFKPASIIASLMNSFLILKFGRLLWPRKSKGDDNFSDWPVFGLFGWLKNNKQVASKGSINTFAKNQLWQVYGFIAISLALGFVLPNMGVLITTWQIGLVAFVITPFVARRVLDDMTYQHLAHEASKKKMNEAEAQAIAAHSIALAQEQMNQQLLAKNNELCAKNAELERAKADAEQARAEALQARDEAERAKAHEETISRALRTASHDLQQSIALIGFAGNEMVRATSIAERERALETFYDVNNKVSTAIEQIMYYAKLTTKQAQPKIQAIEICSTLHRLSTQWMAAGFEKGVDVILTYPRREEIKRYVACDPMLLLHVLQNLLINAILHGGPTCDRIFLCARNRADHYLVQVRDCGKGIEECDGADEYANFAAFAKRVYERGTQRGDGHGLGVNIVKQMCEVAGIRIGLRSHVGGGTTFNLRIAKASVELIDETAAIAADNLNSREQAKVLRFSK